MPVLLVVLLALASAGETQAAPSVPRVGMLCTHSCGGSLIDAFLDELRKLGWVEGSSIVIERKGAGGRLDQLPALATDLVRSKPDLIVAFSPQPVRAAKDATSEIPIVMLFVSDPVGLGLASSLARPGGNLTGVATVVPGAFVKKSLGLLRELLPQAKRVVALINPSNEIHRLLIPTEAPPAAATLGFQFDVIEVRKAEEIPGAIATAKAGGAEALYVAGDTILNSPTSRVSELAVQAGLPPIFWRAPERVADSFLTVLTTPPWRVAAPTISIEFSKAPNRPIFQLSSPPNSCLPSTSRPRNRLVLKSRRRFSPAPTR